MSEPQGMQPQQPPPGSPAGGRRPESVPAHLRPVPGLAPRPRAKSTVPQTHRQKQVTPAEEVAFSTVEVQMGGRQVMLSTLSTAQLPASVERVLGAIGDPSNDRVSLAKICAEADVSLAYLLKIFQAAALARGQLAAMVKVAHRLPDVAAAVMDDAVAEDRVCEDCLGARELPDPTKDEPTRTKECSRCKGRGTVRHKPDHEVQKTALKLGKLLETGGVRVNVNQQTAVVATGADSGSYDKLVSALDNHLYGQGRDRLHPGSDDAIDGEVAGGDQDGTVA